MLKNLNNFVEPYRSRIKEYIELLQKHFGENFISAVVYGSVARGEQKNIDRYESDIDILAVVDNLADRFSIERLNQKIAVGRVYSVVAKLVTPEELEQYLKAKTGFILDAFADGIIVFDAKDYLAKRREELFIELNKKGVTRKPNLGWVFPARIGEKVEY